MLPLRIAILDDHVIFRDGLRALLRAQPDLSVVAEAGEARGPYALIETTAPEVAVVDISLPGSSGISATQEIVRRWPECRVLVLTMYADAEHAGRAFAAGATGYALKEQGAAEVVEAIRAVGAGRRYVAPAVPAVAVQRAGLRTSLDELTVREREVFDLILESRSNRDIAGYLCISVKTVETHRAAINRKLAAHSTADLVRIAARLGLIAR